MNYFTKVNANPYNKKTGDCVIRALHHATGESYESIAETLFKRMQKTGYMMTDSACYIPFIEERGFNPIKVLRVKGHCIPTVKEFANQHERGVYILSLANHIVTVKNGFYLDSWDSGRKSIYKYWQKG